MNTCAMIHTEFPMMAEMRPAKYALNCLNPVSRSTLAYQEPTASLTVGNRDRYLSSLPACARDRI
jgi:hypothetical protein